MPEILNSNESALRDPSFENIRLGFESLASAKHPERNEDFLLVNKEQGLFGVFDGLGGYAGGDVASRLAGEAMNNEMTILPKDISPEQVREEMREIFRQASRSIENEAEKSDDYYDMGTTASLVQLCRNSSGKLVAVVGQVGDSRVYRYRKNELTQLTSDDSGLNDVLRPDEAQSLMEELIKTKKTDTKKLSPLAALLAGRRNSIRQCLGHRTSSLSPNVGIHETEEGDVFVIMSDGISDNLLNSEMQIIMDSTEDVMEQTSLLVRAASARSKQETVASKSDDMTAVVFRIPS